MRTRLSKLGAAIDVDGVAGDPSGVVGGEEGDHAADVVRLGEALQGLHAEREFPARIGLGEVRHVGLDHARGDGVHANTARAKHEGEVLHQRVDGTLRRGVGRQRADSGMGRERGLPGLRNYLSTKNVGIRL